MKEEGRLSELRSGSEARAALQLSPNFAVGVFEVVAIKVDWRWGREGRAEGVKVLCEQFVRRAECSVRCPGGLLSGCDPIREANMRTGAPPPGHSRRR